MEHYVRAGIAALIILNVVAVTMETVAELRAQIRWLFFAIDAFSVAVFSVEYVLRVWSAVEIERFRRPIVGRLRYMVTFYALIDLLAILPFYLEYVLHRLITVDLRMLRGLRLIRLLRVLKLGRYSEPLAMLVRVARAKRDEMWVSVSVISLILLMSSALMYFLEHDDQPEAFPNIPAALWWGVATLTTVGYGDVYPITAVGKLCAAVIALLGIGLVALPSGLIVAGFVEEMEARRQAAREQQIDEEIAEEVEQEVEAYFDEHASLPNYCPHCGGRLGHVAPHPPPTSPRADG